MIFIETPIFTNQLAKLDDDGTAMKTNELEFDAKELIRSVEQMRDHVTGKQKITLKMFSKNLPNPVKTIKAKEIRALRERLHLSQSVFAAILNVPKTTEISWETGRRHPTGAALRLLDLARKDPKTLLKLIAA